MEPILLELHADKTSMVFDPHDGEEFGYVLEGRILLVNGEKEYPVKKGETFYIHGKYRHYLRNVGKQDVYKRQGSTVFPFSSLCRMTSGFDTATS